MKDVEKKIGYEFKRRELLQRALTHSSYANENRAPGCVSNERLEFLGDSVLGFVTAEYLYTKHPELPEGMMTRLRAELVCEKSLAAAAASISLGEFILLGRGEEKGDGRARPSILADAMEAVFAAVYLDGGMDKARELIKRLILSVEDGPAKSVDYKTALQELVQKKSGQTLIYELTGERGPEHMKVFNISVLLNGREIGRGTGKSKKEAEQSAAKAGIEFLGE